MEEGFTATLEVSNFSKDSKRKHEPKTGTNEPKELNV
jgi:hypothetical protein